MGLFICLMMWSILSASIFFIGKNTKNKKIVYILLVYIPLIFISGLRNWNVGTDTILFHQWYDATKNVNIEDFGWFYQLPLADGSTLEWGFVWIGHFFNMLNLDVQVMIFIYSMITILGMGYAFYKYSKSVWLSTFLFIALYSYAETLNMAKQWVAVMIMFNAFGYLKSDYRLKYLGMIFLSIIFHFSAVIHVIILFLMPIKIKKSIAGLIFFIILGIISWNFVLTFAGTLSLKYLSYAGTSYAMEKNFGAGILQIFGILILMAISYYLYRNKKFSIEEQKEVIICNVFMIFLIMMMYSQYIIIILYRFVSYFFVYLYLLVPLIVDKMTKTTIFIKFIVYTMIVIIGFIYCIVMMNLGHHEVIPYNFCF